MEKKTGVGRGIIGNCGRVREMIFCFLATESWLSQYQNPKSVRAEVYKAMVVRKAMYLPMNNALSIACVWGYGAMAARLTPDQKVQSSNLCALKYCMLCRRRMYMSRMCSGSRSAAAPGCPHGG